MRIEEAFDAHSAQLEGLLTCKETVCSNHEGSIKRAAREIALAVHFEACERLGGKLTRTDIGWDSQLCGDDTDTKPIWYCERAKALKELEA